MPSESIAGSVKFLELKAHCNRGSSVAEGNCPDGRKMSLPIWQRNGIPPVGVPVQYPAGAPVGALHVTVNGVPAKIAAPPLIRQPSITTSVNLFFQRLLPLGTSYPKFRLSACGRLATFLVSL